MSGRLSSWGITGITDIAALGHCSAEGMQPLEARAHWGHHRTLAVGPRQAVACPSQRAKASARHQWALSSGPWLANLGGLKRLWLRWDGPAMERAPWIGHPGPRSGGIPCGGITGHGHLPQSMRTWRWMADFDPREWALLITASMMAASRTLLEHGGHVGHPCQPQPARALMTSDCMGSATRRA